MPAAFPSEPEVTPRGSEAVPEPKAEPMSKAEHAAESPPDGLDAAARARYLAEVMADIDEEVRRRRASGDLPPGLERELDDLFLEFSPVGSHGRARLRETLSMVDGAAYVDIAVPVESQKAIGSFVKRLIRKSMSWYLGFIVHQIVKFAWAVSRMLHVLVDHVEDLEATIDGLRTPGLAPDTVPPSDDVSAWWVDQATTALSGLAGRVLHADCGNGSLVAHLVAQGVDAYGVDPSETATEGAIASGLDVRAESMLDHLGVVADEALAGMALTGSIQWLRPSDRDHLVALATSRLAVGGVLVIQSSTPEGWHRNAPRLVLDLAPGRPLHPDTWSYLLAQHGLRRTALHLGGEDQQLERVASGGADSAAVNAAIDALNRLSAGPGEYLLVAVRER